jgi:signal transduction histidine kinase
MTNNRTTVEQLADLAAYLSGRRETVLRAWREVADADPELATASNVSLTHFLDLAADVLEAFERKLRAGYGDPETREDEKRAWEHGSHRWQQGYSIREMVREWGHFQVCVADELELYAASHPELESGVMPFARRLWALSCNEALTNSVEEYVALQQAEAAGVLRDLQTAVEQVKQLDQRRAEAWHEAAHDLRGNVDLVVSSTYILSEDGIPDSLRTKAVGTLQSGVTSLRHLLEDLISLARLEAGRERRNLETFDAAAQLRGMALALEPLARERNLSLQTEGPETLAVEGDRPKVQRIVQNLVLNALRYTREGRVTVTWAETRDKDVDRWLVRIQDTGPGLQALFGVPVGAGLAEATRGAKKAEEKQGELGVEPAPDPGPTPEPSFQPPGEGIGLSIVKRLCELLEATLEAASRPGEGTVFQVVFPRRYDQEKR